MVKVSFCHQRISIGGMKRFPPPDFETSKRRIIIIIQCYATDGRQLYLLRYWWHHSICYTGLFTTPRVVITISPYNESWHSVMSCLGVVLGSLLSWMLAANWLADCY
jgi:hypothetical protein